VREGQNGRVNGGGWQGGNEQEPVPCSQINNTESGSIARDGSGAPVQRCPGGNFGLVPGRFHRLFRTPVGDCGAVLLGWDVITVEQCQVRQVGNAADYFVNRPAMLSECGAPVSGGSGALVRLRRAWGYAQRALLLTIDDKKTSFRRKTAYEPRIEDVKNRPCLSRGLRYHENSCRGRIDSSPVAGTTSIT